MPRVRLLVLLPLLLLAAVKQAAGQNANVTSTAVANGGGTATDGGGGGSPPSATTAAAPSPAGSSPITSATSGGATPSSQGNATAMGQAAGGRNSTIGPAPSTAPANVSAPAPASTVTAALPPGSSSSVALPPQPDSSGWRLGRATYYGAPKSFASAYDPTRGEGSFGILAFGSCGYTNMPGGVLPFPSDAVAALPDARPDYPGSCGRCYEVACEPGLVYGNNGRPIRLAPAKNSNGTLTPGRYIDGDIFRPYLPDINPRVPDSQGRLFPGNPSEAQDEVSTVCNKGSPTIRVRIVDSCPCTQVLSESAPGVAKGGETRRQEWCCGPLDHFDLSYDALEKLAHPISGVIMVRYRAVDCDSGAAISRTYVSPTIFSAGGGIQPGWGWTSYGAGSATLQQSASPAPPGVGGSQVTCVSLSPGGGLTFYCRQCARPGFQPFAGKRALQFWIRSNSDTTDPFASSTPAGQVPPMKLFVMKDEPVKQYCSRELYLANTTQPDTQAEGGWARFQIPLSDFGCGGSLAPQDQLERVDFQNTQQRNALFCLTDIELVA